MGWPRGEAAACKAVYTGSNPVPTSVKTMVSGQYRLQWAIGAAVARFPDTEEVTGSIPVSPTKQGNLLHAVRPAPAGTHFISADVAQLVEHHLAKVRVAGSSPVIRSKSAAQEGNLVGWPSGEAAACKAVYTGSNPVPTSVKTMVSG